MKTLELRNIKIIVLLLLIISFFGCSSTEELKKPSEPTHVGLITPTLVNLSAINSAEDDFAPWLTLNGTALYVTSNRAEIPTDKYVDNSSKFGEHVFISDGKELNWSMPVRVSGIGETNFNTGTISVTGDGKTAYFGAAYRDDGVGGTDIYRSRMAGMQWGKPECIKILSSKWWDPHPCISPNGTQIVFASDRDNPPTGSIKTSTQTDLYISNMSPVGEWETPVKLPPPINSPQSEISPFFGSDGYLYFATNRYPDKGFEIVRSQFINGAWIEPEILDAPINSSADECFPFLSSDRSTMYFASNRPGGKGGLDIYASGFPYRIKLNGTITLSDEKQINLVPGVSIPITVENTKTHEVRTIQTDANGKYEMMLSANADYRITTGSADCYSTSPPDNFHVGAPYGIDTVITRDYTLPRVVFPKFELGRFNIPFFVTGYYMPNTPANLLRFKERVDKKELDILPGGRTPYIDPNDEQYFAFADSIQHIFETVYNKIEKEILPLFNKCAYTKERLKIEVMGFVDPRGLSYGAYIDKTIETDSMRVEQGSVMVGQPGNIKLGNLRAYYTLEMIDQEMEKRSQEYRTLKQQGRILFSAYGKGVDVSVNPNLMQDPAKRRIDITLTIEKPK